MPSDHTAAVSAQTAGHINSNDAHAVIWVVLRESLENFSGIINLP